MGQVVPFIRRVRESADWSAEERARLEALADQLAQQGVRVEVIFGATDQGDPWCAVLDDHGEVLIHVARIDGRFVVHSAMDDVLSDGEDLHAVLRERLDSADEFVAQPKSAEIIPFVARHGQTFLALLAAAAFFYETAGLGESAEAADLAPLPLAPADGSPPTTDTDQDAPAQDRQLAAQGAALQEQRPGAAAAAAAELASQPDRMSAAAPPPTPPPALADAGGAVADGREVAAAAAPAEPIVIRGTDGGDSLAGTAADEHILGGDGDDTISGGGGRDLLEGGAGDDRIELTSDAMAIGGAGADTFVIQAPARLSNGDTLLGVILDFEAADRVITATGRTVQLPPPGSGGPVPNGFGPATVGDGPPAPPSLGSFQTAGRSDVDLDGDGVADGYLLVLFRTTPAAARPAPDDAPGVPVRLLGPDPTDAGQVLIDIDGDGAADGAIRLANSGDETLLMVGRSLLSVDPLGA